MAESAKKPGKPTHHPDTGLPYAEPPVDVKVLIAKWDISLDSVRCYVKPIEAEEKTAGGLIMPEAHKGHNFKSGWVIAAGPDTVLKLHGTAGEGVEYRVRPGDVCCWGKFAGAKTDRLDRGEKDLLVMNCVTEEGDVLGIISHGR